MATQSQNDTFDPLAYGAIQVGASGGDFDPLAHGAVPVQASQQQEQPEGTTFENFGKVTLPSPASTQDTGSQAGIKNVQNTLPSIWNAGVSVAKILPQIGMNLAQLPGEELGAIQDARAARQSAQQLEAMGGPKAPGLIPRLRETTSNIGQGGLGMAVGMFPGLSGIAQAGYGYATHPSQLAGDIGTALTGNVSSDNSNYDPNIDVGLRLGAKGMTEGSAPELAQLFLGARDAIYKVSPKAGAAFDSAVSKTAKPVTVPTEYIAGKAKAGFDVAGKVGRSAVGQTVGVPEWAVKSIIENPKAFEKDAMSGISREKLGEEVLGGLQKRIDDLSETGREYAPIRKDAVNRIPVAPDALTNLIKETTGLELTANGKLYGTADATIRKPSEIAKLQTDIVEVYQPEFAKGFLTNNQFLNLRKDLAGLANYEGGVGKSGPLKNMSSIMRGKLNTIYRPKVAGLEDLDAVNSSQIQELNLLKEGIMQKRGVNKGKLLVTAPSKIAGATNKGRGDFLEQLEEISPGIKNKIAVLNVMDAFDNASLKTGAYMKVGNVVAGGFVGGPWGAVVTAIAEMILSNPEVSIPLLRAFGKNKAFWNAVIQKLIGAPASALNQLPNRLPGDLIPVPQGVRDYIKNPKLGLGLEDVSMKPFEKIGLKREDIVSVKHFGSAVEGKANPNDYDFMVTVKDGSMKFKSQAGLPAPKVIKDGKNQYFIMPESEAGNLLDAMLYTGRKEKGYSGKSVDVTPSLMPKKANGAVDTGKPIIPAYKDTGALSTKVLGKLEGKTTVSKQFISDLTNSPDLKQPERDLIRSVLAGEGDTVNVKDFADKVKTELLPLKRSAGGYTGGRYEGVSLPDDLRGPVAKYGEHVYESPIKTSAGDVHFRGDSMQNYFAHTRIEDLPADVATAKAGMVSGAIDSIIRRGAKALQVIGTIRRIIELQSDLFQKGRLETDSALYEGNYGNKFPNDLKDLKAESQTKIADQQKSLAKLEPYRNTWQDRIIREEVRQAAIDGKTKLQFPTGETAMKIEGLGDSRGFFDAGGELVSAENLKVGKVVTPQDGTGSEWIITDILGDGKFKAVTKDQWESAQDAIKNPHPNYVPGKHESPESVIERYKETFDISGKVDTENPIFKFYEKEVGRYLKNNFGAKLVTDAQGVTWYEVDITPAMKSKPIQAFGIAGLGLGLGLAPKKR